MFDVFQNVLFGKKKSNSEAEKEKAADDFVMIGQASNDPFPPKEPESFNDRILPKNRFGPSFLPDDSPPAVPSPRKEAHHPIMPLQDVPFTINSSLSASAKLEQIWKTIALSISNIETSNIFKEEYDFSLEKSVIAETSNK